jgi:hypothetical protein
MQRTLAASWYLVVLTLILVGAVYAADSLRVWYSQRGASGGAALGSVTFYIAVTLKSGRTEIYYDQPQTEVCVRALFPHVGYRPCWYAARDRVRPG